MAIPGFQSVLAGSPRYRPDIDGLRGIAVLTVVLYHVYPAACPGGFVGVDVFFVISGFLIAQVIQDGLDAGTFSLARFYLHRIRRILPALLLVLLVSTLAASLLFSPADFAAFGQSLAAASVSLSNVVFANQIASHGYFAPPVVPQPLLHTWSLGVEEQFYLLFPALMLLLTHLPKWARPVVLLSLLVASLGWAEHTLTVAPMAAFYLLPSRAWELLAGALLTVASPPKLRIAWLRQALSLAGLLAIGYAAAEYSSTTPFPGLHALLPCAGALLLLSQGDGTHTIGKDLLRFPPLVYVGVLSYSLYLWHWPLLVFARYLWQVPPRQPLPGTMAIIIVALALALAALSSRFVEIPFRRRPYRIATRAALVVGIGGSLLTCVLGQVILHSGGLPQRFDPNTRALLAENTRRQTELPKVDACVNARTDPRVFSDVTFCATGHSARNILVWGDSHAEQLRPVLETIQTQGQLQGHGLVFAIARGCPLSDDTNNMFPGYHCDAFNRFAMQRALAADIDTVFFETSPWWYWSSSLCASVDGRCVQALSPAEESDRILGELDQRIHSLQARGKRVIVGLPFPAYRSNIPQYEIGRITVGRWHHVQEPLPVDLHPFAARIRAIAEKEGATIYDPRPSLCAGLICRYESNGISMYIDENHLAPESLGLLEPGLVSALTAPH
jgi:peptidoglycan/LPS O-acetylase OafA/YrhL